MRKSGGNKARNSGEAMILYKYAHSDRISDLLEFGRIRATQPKYLNDPFEVSPSFGPEKKEMHDELLRESGNKVSDSFVQETNEILEKTRMYYIENFNVKFGIISLSAVPTEPLMWSHYADSHKGFVVGFDSKNPYFYKSKYKRRFRKVIYSDEYYILPSSKVNPNDPISLERSGLAWFFTKHTKWRDEKEYRMLADLRTADARIRKGDEEIFLFEFPFDSVKEIILGCKMTNENRNMIKDIHKRKYSKAVLYEASCRTFGTVELTKVL
jgi:hypothetical protein